MSSFMNNIRAIIKMAEENNGFISIKGYVSKSSGQVADFIVQPLGDQGYIKKVKQALEQAKQLVKPKDFSQETWDVALAEKIASYEKTLGEGHGRKDSFSKEKKGFYGHDDNDAVYIRNVVKVSKKVHVEGEFKKVNSRPKTIVKKWIHDQTCLKTYQATFKLEEGTFDKVTYKGTSFEG